MKTSGTSYLAVLISLIFTLGCNDAISNRELPKETPDTTTRKQDIIATVDTIFAADRDTAVRIDNGEAFIKGRINANMPRPKYTISLLKNQTVTAVIKSLKKGGNVRINQIQRPDGSFDGPFGDSLSYTLKRDGNIRFIVGENLMAGDPYTGDFILHVVIR